MRNISGRILFLMANHVNRTGLVLMDGLWMSCHRLWFLRSKDPT